MLDLLNKWSFIYIVVKHIKVNKIGIKSIDC